MYILQAVFGSCGAGEAPIISLFYLWTCSFHKQYDIRQYKPVHDSDKRKQESLPLKLTRWL